MRRPSNKTPIRPAQFTQEPLRPVCSEKRTHVASVAAAAGAGSPWKYRLSFAALWALNRANRKPAQAVNKNPTSQPISPKGANPH